MKPTLTTPKGIARYPRLNDPDCRFSPEGVYTVTLRVAKDEAMPLVTKLVKMLEDFYAAECKDKGKKLKRFPTLPWGPAKDWDKENQEEVAVPGFIDFRFKTPAKGTTKEGKQWERKVALFDAKLNPLPADSDPVGGGSVIRVSFGPNTWNVAATGVGISLRLNAVQVLELKTYGGSGSYGFVEEDGFAVKATAAATDVGSISSQTEDPDF
jgi:hypothetical protein